MPQSTLILIFLLIASAVALGVALVSQYVFHLHPCHLCILQRWPYVAVMVLAAVGVFSSSSRAKRGDPSFHSRKPKGGWLRSARNDGIITTLIILSMLALLTGAGIAAYHAGVEAGIFKGPDGCSNTGGGESLEEMRRAILNAPLVSCSQAMATFMGLSMAAWNALYALACAVIAFFLFIRSLRKK